MNSSTIEKCVAAIGKMLALAFIAAVALNVVNVVTRYGFGFTINVADELQLTVLVFMTFLGAAIVSWRREHLRMDILMTAAPGWLRRTSRLLEFIATAWVCGFIVYQSVSYVSLMFRLGRRSDSGDLPMWIPHSAITIGFGLMTVVLLLQALSAVASGAIKTVAEKEVREVRE